MGTRPRCAEIDRLLSYLGTASILRIPLQPDRLPLET